MYDVLEVSKYIINYSNEKQYGISNLKLQKILYLVQAYFLIKKEHHTPCFDDQIEAWDFGPVVPKAYRVYKKYGSSDISVAEPQVTVLFGENKEITNEDKELINSVVDAYRNYSATDLVKLTHEQDPWKNTYVKYRNRIITIDSMRSYFNV